MGNRACGGARIASKVFRFCSETDKGAALPSPKRLPSARLLEAGLRAGRHRASPKTALARPPVIFPPLSEGLLNDHSFFFLMKFLLFSAQVEEKAHIFIDFWLPI